MIVKYDGEERYYCIHTNLLFFCGIDDSVRDTILNILRVISYNNGRNKQKNISLKKKKWWEKYFCCYYLRYFF